MARSQCRMRCSQTEDSLRTRHDSAAPMPRGWGVEKRGPQIFFPTSPHF